MAIIDPNHPLRIVLEDSQDIQRVRLWDIPITDFRIGPFGARQIVEAVLDALRKGMEQPPTFGPCIICTDTCGPDAMSPQKYAATHFGALSARTHPGLLCGTCAQQDLPREQILVIVPVRIFEAVRRG